MEIEILDFIPMDKGSKRGSFDVRIIYNLEKLEIFRNLSYFEKENQKWISISNCQRNEKWLPSYERQPDTKKLFVEILAALEEYLIKQKSASVHNDDNILNYDEGITNECPF